MGKAATRQDFQAHALHRFQAIAAWRAHHFPDLMGTQALPIFFLSGRLFTRAHQPAQPHLIKGFLHQITHLPGIGHA